ncbi:MAG: nuclear transport factor 2 family protein [Myxococcota bacterium]
MSDAGERALAHAEIRSVLALYYQALDARDLETLRTRVMAEDATWRFVQRAGTGRFEDEASGRDAVVDWFARMLGGDVTMGEGEVVHSIDTTVIELAGERATSSSVVRCVDVAKLALVAAGRARAELVRTREGWRIRRYEIDERITDDDMRALQAALAGAPDA